MMKFKPDKPDTVIMFGKEVLAPRSSAHYLQDYHYTGRVHTADPLPEIYQPLIDWCNEMVNNKTFTNKRANVGEFNQVLVNYYLNGLHYIGKHSDDEKQLLTGSVVFSASFGQERTFRIRKKLDNSIVKDITMKHGSFIVMGGDMQKEFTHEVPKIMGNKGLKLKPRINVTFRMFKT